MSSYMQNLKAIERAAVEKRCTNIESQKHVDSFVPYCMWSWSSDNKLESSCYSILPAINPLSFFSRLKSLHDPTTAGDFASHNYHNRHDRLCISRHSSKRWQKDCTSRIAPFSAPRGTMSIITQHSCVLGALAHCSDPSQSTVTLCYRKGP